MELETMTDGGYYFNPYTLGICSKEKHDKLKKEQQEDMARQERFRLKIEEFKDWEKIFNIKSN